MRSRSSRELLARLREEMERFPGEKNRSFRQALHAWARALEADRTGGGLEFPSFEGVEREEGVEMTTLLEANLNRWDARVRAEAARQARAEEGARLLRRLATAKFDAHTA